MSDPAIDRLVAGGIVPVVRAPSPELATRAVEAICAGGIDVIELTMTVPGAVGVIAALRRRFGDDVLVGAGTVLDASMAQECIGAGAQFLVSPIFDPAVVALGRTRGIAVLPGVLTPTEVVMAMRAGAELLKVFPCGAVGGASYLRALKAPLPHAKLLPTGGVSIETVGDFIRAGASAVGVGADLVDVGRIEDGRASEVTERARRYRAAVREAREKTS